MLVNGQIVHGGHAMAGEFGHVTIDEQGPPCPCGKRGCWERYASNSAAVQHYVPRPELGGRRDPTLRGSVAICRVTEISGPSRRSSAWRAFSGSASPGWPPASRPK